MQGKYVITLKYYTRNVVTILAVSVNYFRNLSNSGDSSEDNLSRLKREENYQQFRNKRLTTRLVGDVEVVVQGNLKME